MRMDIYIRKAASQYQACQVPKRALQETRRAQSSHVARTGVRLDQPGESEDIPQPNKRRQRTLVKGRAEAWAKHRPRGSARHRLGRRTRRLETLKSQTSELVFDYVCAYITQHGYPPSLRNIGLGCQLCPSAVAYNLDKLEAQGWLTREPHVARSLRILRRKPA